MTTTEPLVTTDDGPAEVERSAVELRAAARQAWLDNPSLTGVELGATHDRSERWGREIIAEAKAAAAAEALPPGTNGSHPAAATHPNGSTTAADAGASAATETQRQVDGVPTALVAVTVAAVAIVAVVTMVTSYSHTYDLAVIAGQERVAKFLPAAVDGLVIAGSTSLLVDHHQHRPASPLAWAAVVLGLLSSTAANVVAVDPTLVELRHVKWVMAAYAPLALAVSGHLLLRMVGQRH